MTEEFRIPVMRPQLPRARDLAPFLDAIDTTRRYTNFGDLTRRLEQALAVHFNASDSLVVTSCNGTLALAAALAEAAPGGRGQCVLPAWTFAATARAAELAGFEVVLMDVDPETWALEPAMVSELTRRDDHDIAVVMPVAPFGAPLDLAAWEAWRADTGIPVVVDAAAGIDTARASSIPTIISLHATKALGVGEGGCVIAPDTAFADGFRKRTNFGLPGPSPRPGFATNAKMSEYAAAVGLAALADWPNRRAALRAVARRYVDDRRLGDIGRFQDGFGARWTGATANLRLERGAAAEIRRRLADRGVETRRWWERGVFWASSQDASAFPNARDLDERVLGLPFSHDLAPGDQDEVIDALVAVA